MTITREEFKELVQIYRETWAQFCELTDYYNENLLDELMFTTLSWIERKLGLTMENEDFDILGDLITYGHVPVDIKCNENEYDWEWTNDLDKIYDYYLAPKAANN